MIADRIPRVVTDTLSPAGAASDVTLPQRCDRTGGQPVYQALNLPAEGSKVREHTVHTVERAGAIPSNSAEVHLRDGVDFPFHDNQAGPVEVKVEAGGTLLYLPIVSKP